MLSEELFTLRRSMDVVLVVTTLYWSHIIHMVNNPNNTASTTRNITDTAPVVHWLELLSSPRQT